MKVSYTQISSTALAGEVAGETAIAGSEVGGGAARPRRQEITMRFYFINHFIGAANAAHPLRPLRGHLPRVAVEETAL